jgi:hypothetical protein
MELYARTGEEPEQDIEIGWVSEAFKQKVGPVGPVSSDWFN